MYNFIAEVGDVTGVAESTIKATYKEIVPHTRQLFPSDFKFATSPGNLMLLFNSKKLKKLKKNISLGDH